jgi:serine/threonine protein kinase
MSGDREDLAEAKRRLDAVLTPYFDAVKAGRPPDREVWLNRYPYLAGELSTFLDEHERLLRATEAVRSIATGETNGRSSRLINESVADGDTADRDTAGSAGLVFGGFELLGEPIHRGMSVIYRARALQPRHDRGVAVKILRGGALGDDQAVRRFFLEAQTVAFLQHPNIVPIYEVGEHYRFRYVVLGLIDGDSLSKRLLEYVSHPRAAAILVAKVARAVDYMHGRGVLHCGLEPSNILIDGQGEPYVTDFGQAVRADVNREPPQWGAILDMPAYMAPEQVLGDDKALSPATDVYTLGAVLYAVLLGRAPFGGRSVAETLEQVRRQKPEMSNEAGSKVYPYLRKICLHCLEKEPKRRYASARALAEDLEHWLGGAVTR